MDNGAPTMRGGHGDLQGVPQHPKDPRSPHGTTTTGLRRVPGMPLGYSHLPATASGAGAAAPPGADPRHPIVLEDSGDEEEHRPPPLKRRNAEVKRNIIELKIDDTEDEEDVIAPDTPPAKRPKSKSDTADLKVPTVRRRLFECRREDEWEVLPLDHQYGGLMEIAYEGERIVWWGTWHKVDNDLFMMNPVVL